MSTEEQSIAITEPAAGEEQTIVDASTQVEEQQTDESTSEDTQEKTEKSEAERIRQKMQRGIDRRTRQLAEARAEAEYLRKQVEVRQTQTSHEDDSEPITLSRAEYEQRVKQEAAKLAPTLQSEASEIERRTSVVKSLEKEFGQERFNELAEDLDDAFGGLVDQVGRAKPVMDAIFESDIPSKLIEYFANPEHADEAESLSKMTPTQVGRAIDKIEAKLKDSKPKPSKVPPPIEAVRGKGGVDSAPNPADTKAWIRWRNEQERKGL